MVSARPDTTWLDCRVMETKAWITDINAEAMMAASSPSHGLPVVKVTIKAVTAPMAIMPSIPRFKIPDRSQITSPMVANSKGVPAISVRCKTEIMISSKV